MPLPRRECVFTRVAANRVANTRDDSYPSRLINWEINPLVIALFANLVPGTTQRNYLPFEIRTIVNRFFSSRDENIYLFYFGSLGFLVTSSFERWQTLFPIFSDSFCRKSGGWKSKWKRKRKSWRIWSMVDTGFPPNILRHLGDDESTGQV